MTYASGPPLFNPFTPLAFLPPDQAYQKTITDYVTVGALSVMIWDVLTHLSSDYKIATQHKIKLPTVVYFLSRWSTLLYQILFSTFQTAPVKRCDILMWVICVVYHITVSSTAFLFLLRVRAIFLRNKYISAIFLALWVVVVAGSLSAVLSATGANIGTTQYCVVTKLQPLRSAASNVAVAVFDSGVFVAITWNLSNSHLAIPKSGDPPKLGMRFDVFGRYLPAFTRGLLQDGQKYYFVAMLVNLLVVVLNFIPGVPTPYRVTFWAPVIALANIMACRVFRHTKLGREEGGAQGQFLDTILFRGDSNALAPSFTQTLQQDGGGFTNTIISRNGPRNSSDPETRAPSNDIDLSRKSEPIV